MRTYPHLAVALIAVSVVFPILAFVTLLLRVRSRRITRKRLDVSDYFLFVTMFIALGNAITCIVGATNAGLGQPLEVLSPQTEVAFMKILFATQFFYIFSVFTVKVAIILFYKSIFPSVGFRKAANGLLVLLGTWIVAFFLVTLFQDKPISRNWGTVGKTVNFPVLYIVESVTDITLDLVILAMPLPVIKSLHISVKRRWLLSGVFWLGGFCVIASTLRLSYMIKFQREYHQSRTDDFSQTVVNWIIWGAIEPCTSIMAACLPTLAPIFLPAFHHHRASSSSTYNHHGRKGQRTYSMQWGGGSRGIHTETSVHIKNRAMDSMEHFAHDAGLVGEGGVGFGTLTEVEGGGGGMVGGRGGAISPIPKKVLLAESRREHGGGGGGRR